MCDNLISGCNMLWQSVTYKCVLPELISGSGNKFLIVLHSLSLPLGVEMDDELEKRSQEACLRSFSRRASIVSCRLMNIQGDLSSLSSTWATIP